jgi:hypothetical protein
MGVFRRYLERRRIRRLIVELDRLTARAGRDQGPARPLRGS